MEAILLLPFGGDYLEPFVLGRDQQIHRRFDGGEKRLTDNFMVKLTLRSWPSTLDQATKKGFIKKLEQGYEAKRVGNSFVWTLTLEKPQIQQLADEIAELGAFYSFRTLIAPLRHYIEEGDGDAHARTLLQKT